MQGSPGLTGILATGQAVIEMEMTGHELTLPGHTVTGTELDMPGHGVTDPDIAGPGHAVHEMQAWRYY